MSYDDLLWHKCPLSVELTNITLISWKTKETLQITQDKNIIDIVSNKSGFMT